MSQVVVQPLKPGDIFYKSCSPEIIDTFNQVGKEIGVPPAFLAAFAMQESTCNPNAVAGAGLSYGVRNCLSRLRSQTDRRSAHANHARKVRRCAEWQLQRHLLYVASVQNLRIFSF